jgi:hypothetical protein
MQRARRTRIRRYPPRVDAPDALQAAAIAELARSGPLTLADLAGRLAAAGADLGPDGPTGPGALDHLDEVLLERDEIGDLPDGRLCDLASAVDGVVVTRRLTAEELATGVVEMDADLQALLLVRADALPLADGRTARIALTDRGEPGGDVFQLHCPDAALAGLAPGDLAAFHLRGGVLEIGPCPVLGEGDAAAQALAEAYFDTAADGEPVELAELLLAVLVDQPDVLRVPRPPLSAWFDDTGLERYGDWVGEPGAFDDDGLDAHEREGLDLLLGSLRLAAEDEPDADLARSLAGMLGLAAMADRFAFAALGAGRDEAAIARVERWAQALRTAAPDLPGPHRVLAACAERRGDALAAEQHVAAALRAAPGDPDVLVEAAWYAEDRGDAVRALMLLRRAGVDEADLGRLARYAAPGPARAGRNDPCPCGSGRKHKVCCAQRNGHTLADRVPWLLGKAGEFAQRPGNRGALADIAVARAGGDADDPSWVERALGDPLVTDLALFEDGLLEAFCDERGPLLPADELALARDWLGAPLRLHEVEGAAPGRHVVLRDLTTGDRAEVDDAAASRDLDAGELVLARPLPVEDRRVLSPATLRIPFRLRDHLLAVLDRGPDARELAGLLAAAEAPPTLQTGDGEAVVRCSLVLAVPDLDAAGDALDGILTDEGGWWARHEERDGVARFTGAVHPDDDGRLVVEALSEARFDALVAEVLRALPDADRVDEQRVPGLEGLGGPVETLPADVLAGVDGDAAREALAAFMAEAEERWLDEPVPALGGATPREAADDPTRRGDLERLLDDLAASSADLPVGAATFDAARLRRRLGL